MNTVIRACVVVGAAVLAGCSGKSGGSSDSFAGTWHVDMTGLIGTQKDAVVAQAMATGGKEAAEAAAKAIDAEFAKMKAVVEIQADRTWSYDFDAGGSKETGSGTWSADGSTITLTPKIKDGAPVAGDDTKPMVLTLKDGKLEGKHPKTGEPVSLKR